MPLIHRFFHLSGVGAGAPGAPGCPGGPGLGLAICKEIILRMGGTISFTSEEGKGSAFSFTIPFGEADAERVTGLASGKTATAGDATDTEVITKPRILVAEDDQVTRKVLG